MAAEVFSNMEISQEESLIGSQPKDRVKLGQGLGMGVTEVVRATIGDRLQAFQVTR